MAVNDRLPLQATAGPDTIRSLTLEKSCRLTSNYRAAGRCRAVSSGMIRLEERFSYQVTGNNMLII